MQYLIIIALIAVILIVLGVSLTALANISAWVILMLCSVMTAAMAVFFGAYLVFMLRGRRASGRYLRADNDPNSRLGKYKSAVYLIDGNEHFGVFPADIKAFYLNDKEQTLIIDKKGRVYDRTIRITIIAGLISSVVMTAMLVFTVMRML